MIETAENRKHAFLERAENRKHALIETAKSLGEEGFLDMTSQDIQEWLVEETMDEAGLIEMIFGIHDNSEDDSFGKYKETKKLTLQCIKKGLRLAEKLVIFR